MFTRLLLLRFALTATLVISGVSLSCAHTQASAFDGPRPLSQMRLDTWSLRDGLPSRDITAIAQTPDGYIWLGTSEGLFRFDGVSFDAFNTENTPSLPSNDISALTVARNGDLWIGTDWGGFGRFIDGKFIRFEPPNPQWTNIHSMVQDPDGSMWIAAWGNEPLRHVVGSSLIVYKWVHSGDPGVNAILPMGNGDVICGMPWDTPRIVKPNGSIVQIWTDHKFAYPCSALLRSRDGAIWYATGRSGVTRIKNGHYDTFTADNGLPSDIVTSLFEDRDGRVLVGTSNGLCVWDGTGFESFGKVNGLYDSAVGCIHQDQEGNIWVGSGSGLNRFATTKLVPFTLDEGSSTASNIRIAEDTGKGGVWCGTNLGLWHLGDGSAIHCDYANRWYSHFEGLTEGSKDLWMWTDNAQNEFDIRCVTPKSGNGPVDYHDLMAPTEADAPNCVTVRLNQTVDTAVALKNSLIVFGANKILAISQGKVLWTHPFPTGFTFCARVDSTGTIWVGGTNGLGIWRDGRASLVNSGLPANTHVLGIDASNPNSIWLATDHGLGLLENGRATFFGAGAGLPDTNLFQVHTDSQNRVWVGCNFGIFAIRISDIRAFESGLMKKIPYHALGPSDGIRSFPTVFYSDVSLNGYLWFAGPDGVTEVDPSSNAYNRVSPPVAIEDSILDGVPLSTSQTIIVQPGQGRLTIRYAALSFQAPEKVRFRYKLEGMDSMWTDGGNRRVVSYPFLPPGRYRFVVIACNNDGVWNTTGASVSFVLLPHYYETTWFRIACIVVAILFLTILYYLRIRTIIQHSRELENKVAERTGQLVESNTQLQNTQETLARQYKELALRNDELECVQQELRAHNEELSDTRETLARANAHLEALATTDGLTGLKNHRSFQVQLEAEWERYSRYGHSVSVIMLDVDRFKQYNDTFGHPGGDEVLKRVSSILTAIARESDFVARYGGEEFVVIAPETDEEGAATIAERMRVAIERADWTLRSVTASFGVATATLAQQSAADLLALSDAALFHSKAQGRNKVSCASKLDPKAITATI
jgi:diguanylate cyclase (GGDEF)-like protein